MYESKTTFINETYGIIENNQIKREKESSKNESKPVLKQKKNELTMSGKS